MQPCADRIRVKYGIAVNDKARKAASCMVCRLDMRCYYSMMCTTSCTVQHDALLQYLEWVCCSLVTLCAGLFLQCAVGAALAGEEVGEYESTWWFKMDNGLGSTACMRFKASSEDNTEGKQLGSSMIEVGGTAVCDCANRQGGYETTSGINMDFDPQSLDDCNDNNAETLTPTWND